MAVFQSVTMGKRRFRVYGPTAPMGDASPEPTRIKCHKSFTSLRDWREGSQLEKGKDQGINRVSCAVQRFSNRSRNSHAAYASTQGWWWDGSARRPLRHRVCKGWQYCVCRQGPSSASSRLCGTFATRTRAHLSRFDRLEKKRPHVT